MSFERCPEPDELIRLGTAAASPALLDHVASCGDCRAAVAATVDVERLVAGRYRLRRVLGRGSAGEVWLASDERLSREVALKFLPDGALDARGEDLLLKEARVLASLSHPHVLTVHDAGVDDGHPFLVMALASGGSLATRLERGPLPWAQVARLFADAAGALDAAHRLGIVHCDVKPANLLLDGSGQVQVADFGLARVSADAAHGAGAVGTPAYMAPEVARGEPPTPRADQFSLAASLFEALTAQRPFPLTSREAWLAALQGGCPPVPPGLAPQALERVLRKALDPVPAQRFDDLGALREALLASLRAPTRQRWALATAALAVAAAGLFVLGQQSAATDPCDGADAALAHTGVDARLATLADALRAAPGPRAAEVRPLFEARAQAFRDAWRSTWESSCRDTHERHRLELAQLGQRQACLEAEVDQLSALLEQSVPRVAATPDLALDVMDALEPQGCVRPRGASMTAWLALPREVLERDDLYRLLALRTAQDFDAGEKAARALRDEARRTGRRGLEAESEYWLGVMLYLRGEMLPAREPLRQAELLAEAAGDDRLRGRALVTQAFVEAVAAANYDGAHALLDRAQAVFERVEPGVADQELLYVRGTVFQKEKRLAEAEAAFLQATPPDGERIPDWIQVTRARARVRLWGHHCAEAAALFEAVVARARAFYGEAHPIVSAAWNDLGTAYKDAGALRQAREALRHAEAMEAAVAEAPINARITRMHLAALDFELAPGERTAQALDAAADALEATQGAATQHAEARRLAAEAHLQLGDVAAAALAAAAAEGVLKEKLKPSHPNRGRLECLQARLDVARGARASALERDQRVLATQAGADATCAALGLAQLTFPARPALLARVLTATEGDETRDGALLRAQALALAGDVPAALALLGRFEGSTAAATARSIGGWRALALAP